MPDMKDETVISGLLKNQKALALEAVALIEQQADLIRMLEASNRFRATYWLRVFPITRICL
jgi:hypothetical protein